MAADGCYVVERLLAKRRHHSEVQYLVRWAGFTEASDTWEPAANIGARRCGVKSLRGSGEGWATAV